MTKIYAAAIGSKSEANSFEHFIDTHEVNILVSFWYLKAVMRTYGQLMPRFANTMLDSGAYSAYNCGAKIDEKALLKECRKKTWSEVVALDVINNAEESFNNALRMKKRRPDCMPVFHINEPFEFLQEYCRNFKKVGLSCRFGEPISQSIVWLRHCFNITYPFRFHSFGWIAGKALKEFPFESADSSSWRGATRFGTYRNRVWKKFRSNTTYTLVPELGRFLELQSFLKAQWGKELEKLNK